MAKQVIVRQSGCMGLCSEEPTVEVVVPGMETVVYGKVNAEQAKAIVKEDGSFDTAELGKIMSEKETAAAQAKEQEIAKGSTNPGGGTAGGNKDNEKTEAEKAAESIGKTLAGTNQAAKSVVDSYLS